MKDSLDGPSRVPVECGGVMLGFGSLWVSVFCLVFSFVH